MSEKNVIEVEQDGDKWKITANQNSPLFRLLNAIQEHYENQIKLLREVCNQTQSKLTGAYIDIEWLEAQLTPEQQAKWLNERNRRHQ